MSKKPTSGVFIMGIEVEEIRRAYFAGEVEKLCAQALSNGMPTPEDVKLLGAELEKLKGEEAAFQLALREEVKGPLFGGPRPPGLDQLIAEPTPEEKTRAKEWAEERNKAVMSARVIVKRHGRTAITGGALDREQLMNDAHAMTGLMLWLSEDAREKERAYKKRIIEIIDDCEVSRREAQDRAEVTDEYIAYRNADDLLKLADTFVMNAKKHYGGASGF